jgi:2-polyprenyl-3-methyl-5-hydroxy-6-metoxy-1,4-benzoquinol methylase
MRRAVKSLLVRLIGAVFGSVQPARASRLVFSVIHAIARSRTAKDSLIFLLNLDRDMTVLTGTEARRYGNGVHPKHWHTGYHKFFTGRLRPDERVLDIGCGYGALAYDMACAGAKVTGIDMNGENIQLAAERFSHENLSFIVGDAVKDVPAGKFDTIVMSNVLEHIDKRIDFLQEVQQELAPKRWLIRVPMYERDWKVPLMDELGVDYRLDDTHFIEYKKEEFASELDAAGLKPAFIDIRWGEIWCEAEPSGSTETKDATISDTVPA